MADYLLSSSIEAAQAFSGHILTFDSAEKPPIFESAQKN
jgi:hypothetical protein